MALPSVPGPRRWTSTRLLFAAAAIGLLLSACMAPAGNPPETGAGTETAEPAPGTSSSATPPTITQPETVADNLDAPWSIAFSGTTPLVSERDSGRILELSSDIPAEAVEVGTIPGVVASGEGGLLGICVADGYLYTYFTAATDNRIVRFPLTGEPGTLRLGEAEAILTGIPKAANHNGGRLALGPDGLLYATTGDAGTPGSAQDRTALAGKILRLTLDGSVPADNPFPGSPVYSLGHRNPQGIGWDATGTMYASEFGQDTWDELNIIEPGENYGWPDVEGIAGDPDFVDPVQQWSPAEASPSGIAVTAEEILIANLRGAVLRSVPLDDLARSATRYSGDYGRLRDVTLTPDGQVWMLTNNTDGRGTPGDGDDRIVRIPPGS